MKIQFTFNVLTHQERVAFEYEEITRSNLKKYADHVLSLQKEGVDSVTFDMPDYGKVTVEVVS
jgi:hypothetical protein